MGSLAWQRPETVSCHASEPKLNQPQTSIFNSHMLFTKPHYRTTQNHTTEPHKTVILLLVFKDCDAFTFYWTRKRWCVCILRWDKIWTRTLILNWMTVMQLWTEVRLGCELGHFLNWMTVMQLWNDVRLGCELGHSFWTGWQWCNFGMKWD
jgi:hypothetical protein